MKEFKKIKSLNFLYEVNKDSIVRNVKSKKVLRPYIDHSGYYRFNFNNKSLEEKSKKMFLHQIMMEVFGEEKPEWSTSIDHINRNRLDNRIENLRWANSTIQAQNRDNSYVAEIGKKTIYKAIEKRKKPVIGIEKNGNKKEFSCISEAGEYIKNNYEYKGTLPTIQKTIAMVIKRKRNFCYNHFWEYK